MANEFRSPSPYDGSPGRPTTYQPEGASGFDRSPSLASYQEYPPTRPFINYPEYTRSPNKPVSSFPESNSRAVISALKGLQDKIRKLELERTLAEDNLRSLASETQQYKDALQKRESEEEEERSEVREPTIPLSRHSQVDIQSELWRASLPLHAGSNEDVHATIIPEIESQLSAAEMRCNLLEKQLDYMRKMVQNAETERNRAMDRQVALERERDTFTRDEKTAVPDFSPAHRQEALGKADKLADLEREQQKLLAMQTLAENKIKELQERLKEEQHQRKLVQQRTAEHVMPACLCLLQLQTQAETNRILLEAASPKSSPKPKKKKVKKKKVSKQQVSNRPRTQPGTHYRLNLGDIPFVAGKATTPSHSLGANVQRVIALMKRHNPALCNDQMANRKTARRLLPSSGESSTASASESELSDLLQGLQDEFGQMSFEHQDLTRQIRQADNTLGREDLERELEQLVKRMEAKGEQIAKLRKHKTQLKKDRSRSRSADMKSVAIPLSDQTSEVQVVTTVTTKGSGAAPVRVVRNPGQVEVKRKMLKDMQTLQTSLRRDDLYWDC
ncbi:PREDICTED: centrosomal protein of 57 kDa-like isoform X11 [Branchiostoma belcheri]|uniref:Centrosomal protein of 57 kDa-like isoform X11 n=1 Tax=Branchiostoma belcheri TaxID=7741 RepID=A0A6P4YIP7_BRABE|nr:PREDICTED: centrosomal protein of 57 kDa-like isoform X11 [Branchiostoma belcheri]